MSENALCPEVFASFPTVCAVGKEYQIMVPVLAETLMWAEVGGECFYDESNGILRSATRVHRMAVPAELLDRERSYTICFRKVIERLPYYTKTEELQRVTFSFCPVAAEASELRIYQIADTHSMIEEPIRAASYWTDRGETLDLLVMNGDTPEDCRSMENIAAPYQVSGTVTRGAIPVVYARGNHDLRGVLAEKYAEVTPSRNGLTYYSWRVGPVWGLSLDCGEDKWDDQVEYGNTICCQAFRRRETAYLTDLVTRGAEEFDAPGVKLKLVLCHIPFSEQFLPPFNIEEDTYREWCRLLRSGVKPDLMLSGHNHKCYVTLPGEPLDHKGQPCPLVVGAKPVRPAEGACHYTGTALLWREGKGFEVFFTDDSGAVTDSVAIPE